MHLDLGKRKEWAKYSEFDKESIVFGQIYVFENTFGFLPQHIDSHYNLHLEDKTVFKYVTEFAKEHDIYVRGRGAYIKKLKNLGIRTCDYFLNSLEKEPRKLLEEVKDGVNELMLHPGIIIPGKSYPTSLTKGRQRDLDFLLSDEFESMLKKNGIELMQF
ncbi:MAG: ChbG/HpnK family deacetylase [archaeon]